MRGTFVTGKGIDSLKVVGCGVPCRSLTVSDPGNHDLEAAPESCPIEAAPESSNTSPYATVATMTSQSSRRKAEWDARRCGMLNLPWYRPTWVGRGGEGSGAGAVSGGATATAAEEQTDHGVPGKRLPLRSGLGIPMGHPQPYARPRLTLNASPRPIWTVCTWPDLTVCPCTWPDLTECLLPSTHNPGNSAYLAGEPGAGKPLQVIGHLVHLDAEGGEGRGGVCKEGRGRSSLSRLTAISSTWRQRGGRGARREGQADQIVTAMVRAVDE